MRRFVLALLAASSLLWLGAAHAATRAHYGGTLRVTTRTAPASLDPAEAALSGSLEGSNITSLIFDTLVTLDDRGTPLPALAVAWQPEPGNQRWQFKLRHGVTFQDGTAMTADQVVASLRVANPSWKISPEGDEVVLERDSPAPDLPTELAKPRNGIAKRGGAAILGTGPFAISKWAAGKKLTLTANNDYWGGRPFLDSVEIIMGQAFREQMIALDLGKADLIEAAPEQAHRAAAEGRRVENSAPAELMGLVFTHERQSEDEGRLRTALALSIDRTAMSTVLLQGGGEPAGGLLPNWMTGYAFLFSANSPTIAPTNTDSSGTEPARGQARQASPWTMAYDANDPVAQVVAQRIVLNARDAGMALQLTSGMNPDLRLIRIPILSLDARVALTAMAESLHLPQSKLAGSSSGNSSEDLYLAENALLQAQQVIPLLHVRASYALGANVRNWSEAPNGNWHLGEVWLNAAK